MWPWDHVAVAYVALSLYRRARGRGGPGAALTLVVVAAALAPDMVDKPLAWWLSVLPSGRSLAHSAFTAAAVAAVAYGVERRVRVAGLAAAVVAGWWSHLLADVAYPLFVKGELRVSFLLWPLVEAPESSTPHAFDHLAELVAAFVAFLLTPRGATYLLADLTLLVGALALWVADGAPVARDLWRTVARPEPESEA